MLQQKDLNPITHPDRPTKSKAWYRDPKTHQATNPAVNFKGFLECVIRTHHLPYFWIIKAHLTTLFIHHFVKQLKYIV